MLFPVSTESDAVPDSGEAYSKFNGWRKDGRKGGRKEAGRRKEGTVLIFTLLGLCGVGFLPGSDRGSKVGENW